MDKTQDQESIKNIDPILLDKVVQMLNHGFPILTIARELSLSSKIVTTIKNGK